MGGPLCLNLQRQPFWAAQSRLRAVAQLLLTRTAHPPALITKTDTNPFFVKMREGADGQGRRTAGMTLNSYAGKIDGDHETQVAAIETCIANGAMGILLTASDTIVHRSVPCSRRAKRAFW